MPDYITTYITAAAGPHICAGTDRDEKCPFRYLEWAAGDAGA